MNQAFLDYYSLEPFTQWIHRTLCGVMPEDWAVFIEGLALGIVILLAYAVLAVVLIYMERRVCGAFQCRIGPNRVGGKGGLLQVPADVLKILTKEIIRLRKSDHVLYELAPYLVILASVISFSCLPWHKGAEVLDMQIGIFFVLAASSIGVIGILLAGWSSNSKYTIIGAVRTQVIFFRHVGVFFILHVERVAVHVIILAERITRPILTQVEAAHVGMPREAYAEEIVCLAFLDFRRLPYPAHRGQERILAPVRVRSQRHAAARPRRLQLVEHAQTAVSVRRHKVPHEVHRFFRVVVQPAAYLRHVPIRDHYHSLAGLFHRGGRTPLPYLFFYHTPASFLSPASSGFSLWLRPPRKRSILILRCNCIIP